MSNVLVIIGVVLILSFLVIIHELGHYWAARKNGIKVEEFGIGFPPKLFSWKKGDTKWSFNLIPFGGFVRLYGEDASDPKILKDKESYASKTPWQKLQVVLAGVLMNFLVFWILMSISITVGIDPLITSQAEFKQAFLDGTFRASPGVLVEEVDGYVMEQGVAPGDQLVAIDGEPVDEKLPEFEKLSRNGLNGISSVEFETLEGEMIELDLDGVGDFDVEFFPVTSVPVAKVRSLVEGAKISEVLEVDDVVVAVNGVPVFDVETLVGSFYRAEGNLTELLVERDGELMELTVPTENRYVVAGFVEGAVAEEAGIMEGDRLISINEQEIYFGDDIPTFVRDVSAVELNYVVERDGERLEFDLVPDEDGLIGVSLFPELRLTQFIFDFQPDSRLSSLVEVQKLKKPFYLAPFAALDEGIAISVETAKAFVGTLGNVATKLEVSDQVGGPVEVARLGFHFVSVGGVELLNFIALISLSLAVINILPIPALDGGRFIFIIIEAFRRKPVNPKLEAIIHYIGFMLLILFILVITFNDVARAA